MRRTSRHFTIAMFGMGMAVLLAVPSASADVVSPGFKKIPSRFLLHASRFDDYCEHRCSIEKGDTYEAIAQRVYGDRARAADIAASNPELAATKLPVGSKIVLPSKLAPPSDAKETLAWTFWGYTNISGSLPLQRIYPDDPTEATGAFFRLFAVPAVNAAELEKLIEAAKATRERDPRAPGAWPEEALAKSPWSIHATGLIMETNVASNSPADESTTAVRIVELTPKSSANSKFVVETESVEYRDHGGNVVKAGFEMLLSWRGIPLGLIALVGAIGLRRMRRARVGVAAS